MNLLTICQASDLIMKIT